jgi:transposase-like protein
MGKAMTKLKPIKINHDIPDILGPPIRSGDFSIWNERRGNSSDNGLPEIKLEAPKGYKAEKIDGSWFWVNDCPDCTKSGKKYPYKKCDEHDVCVDCGTHRKELKKTPWGHPKGFKCVPCADLENKKRLIDQMIKFEEANYTYGDFQHNSVIKCPYCGFDNEPENDDYGCNGEESDYECNLCEKTFSVVVNIEFDWSTSK